MKIETKNRQIGTGRVGRSGQQREMQGTYVAALLRAGACRPVSRLSPPPLRSAASSRTGVRHQRLNSSRTESAFLFALPDHLGIGAFGGGWGKRRRQGSAARGRAAAGTQDNQGPGQRDTCVLAQAHISIRQVAGINQRLGSAFKSTGRTSTSSYLRDPSPRASPYSTTLYGSLSGPCRR